MESRVVYTEEVDDVEEAVKEIFDRFSDFKFQKNSLAIIFSEEEIDYSELYEALSQEWDFPIIGCTTMGILTSDGAGFKSDGMSLMVITGDECRFVADVTEELTLDNYQDVIGDMYHSLSDELGCDEKVILSYGVCVTAIDHVSGDDLLRATDAVGKAMPIFGGLASDRFNFEETRVFCNDKVIQNGQVIALIGGDINIRYMSVNSVESMPKPKTYTVTKSKNNEVLELDGIPMVDVLEKEHFEVSKTEVMRDYLLTPFIATVEKPDGAKVRVARNLSFLDLEKRSGYFLGDIPEGSRLEIGIVRRERVTQSLAEVLQMMRKEIDESEHHYTTVICTSCAARYLALSTQINDEAHTWFPQLPTQIAFMGMYSYGEFCPATDMVDNKDYNMFHNFTFTLLAM